MCKTITFAAVHFSVAFSVTYLLTGSWGVASAVALVEPMINTVAYFFHEKAWDAWQRNASSHQEVSSHDHSLTDVVA